MKNKNLIIVTISVAAAVICIALTFWGNWKNNGVLTTDAFVGIMATFIGVCATIIVGVQIVNHLELRKMHYSIKDIEKEREELKYQHEAFSVEMYNARISIGNTLALMALTAKSSGDIATEFTSWVHSIIIDDWTSMKGDTLLYRYKRLSEIANKVILNGIPPFLGDTYKALSILVVPKDIQHYDEIMSLHYKLLSDLKTQLSDKKTRN